MFNYYNKKLLNFATALALIVFTGLGVFSTASAQSILTDGNAEIQTDRERVHMQRVENAADREALQADFSDEEIRQLRGISAEVFTRFTATELRTILSYESRELTEPDAAEQQLINRYKAHLEELAEEGLPELFNLMSVDIGTYIDFSEGSVSGWDIEDLSGIGEVWTPGNITAVPYGNYYIANSDAAGSGDVDVATRLTSTSIPVDNLSGNRVGIYLSHDYRHLGTSEALLEWSTDGNSWTVLDEWTSSLRFGHSFYDLTDDIGSADEVYFRFTYEDNETWAWWWALDKLIVYGFEAEDIYAHTPNSLDFYGNLDFDRMSSSMYGSLEQVEYDLELLETSGSSWTIGYVLLFTDGNNIDSSPRVLQIGGEDNLGAEQRISWDGSTGSGPISGTVSLNTPVDLTGLTLWVGHSGLDAGRWGGEVILQGTSLPGSLPKLFEQEYINTGFGIPTGEFQDEIRIYAAENMIINDYTKVTGVTAYGKNPSQTFIDENLLNGIDLYFYSDNDGVPSGDPFGSGNAIREYSLPASSNAYTIFQESEQRFSINVDLEMLSDEDFLLPPGSYWMVIGVNQDNSHTSAITRWSWALSEPGFNTAAPVIIDPDGAIFPDLEEWSPLEDLLGFETGLAFALHGVLADPPELDPSAPMGLQASLDNASGEVDLTWSSPPGAGFIENFEDGTSETLEFFGNNWSVEDGFLLNDSDGTGTGFELAYHENDLQDFFFEAEISVDYENIFIGGVFFRSDAQPNALNAVDNGYLVGLANFGGGMAVGLFKIDGGGFMPIRNWQPSPNLNEDEGGSNYLSISANGSVFDVYVNGIYEASFFDNTFTTGKAGVMAAAEYEAQYTNDYIAATATSLPRYSNPVVHQVESGRNAGSLVDASASVARTTDAETAIDEAAGGVKNPSGMISEYAVLNQTGLMSGEFVTFNVFRDGSLIGSTTENAFTDNLSDFGAYSYQISATYQYGESGLSSSSTVVYINENPLQRQAAEISEDAFSAELEQNSGEWSESFEISNAGELDLLWSLEESMPFNSGPIITAFGEGADGADVSMLQESIGLNSFGLGVQVSANNRMATRMVLTETWELETFTYYVYQTGSDTDPTITAANLRIWDGEPGNGGSVIFGDTDTDVLGSVQFSGIYRTPESNLTNDLRPVMEAVLEVAELELEAGTYWVDVQFDGSLASGPWMPPVSVLNRPATGNGYALQYLNDSDSWEVGLSGSYEQDFPYTYSGSIQGASECWNDGNDWLSVDVVSGTLDPEASQQVTISVDTDALEPGEYSTTICVFTNDENSQLVSIPVDITIDSDAEPVQAEAPVFSPDPGTYELSVEVTMATDTDGAQVFFTTDGSDPDASSNEYTGPVTVTETTTFRAIAISEDDLILDSDIASATYTISQPGEPAFVQFINNSADPSMAEVELSVNDGEGEVYCWGQGSCASAVQEIESGMEQTFTVTLRDSDDVLAEVTETFTAGEHYTVVLQGVEDPSGFAMNPAGADIGLELLVFSGTGDSSDRGEDEVSFYVIHGSTDAPAVNITVQDGPTLAINVGYGTRTEMFTVAQDSYVIEVRDAGNNAVLYDFTADLSSAGGTYAILASGFVDPSENQNGPAFTLLSVDAEGTVGEFPQATSTEEPEFDLPTMVELGQNYPNPFNPTTQIQYVLPESGEVSLEVYNLNGQRVAVLVSGQQSAGRHTVTFDAERLSSGLYLYRLQTGSTVEVRKMMLVK
ncbi:MAG: chitobiase/beta-hexosaminidase C-terminal domain-containing protein [Balneolia bacterium]|nr:chitobiase/beta-hexosaminidase C-terminal domain-containing protein [Balneolia bacterium]